MDLPFAFNPAQLSVVSPHDAVPGSILLSQNRLLLSGSIRGQDGAEPAFVPLSGLGAFMLMTSGVGECLTVVGRESLRLKLGELTYSLPRAPDYVGSIVVTENGPALIAGVGESWERTTQMVSLRDGIVRGSTDISVLKPIFQQWAIGFFDAAGWHAIAERSKPSNQS